MGKESINYAAYVEVVFLSLVNFEQRKLSVLKNGNVFKLRKYA